MYLLTNSGNYKLRIEMRSKSVGWVSAEYSYFSLENETNWYRLHLWGFSGDCSGDSMQYTGNNNQYIQNGMYFTTSYSDHDTSPYNCALMRGAGWWYASCNWANLNALYNSSFTWWSLYPDSAKLFGQ